MTIVTVQFGSAALDIHCEDPERVLRLAEKINARIASVKDSVAGGSENKTLFLVALMMQDEIEALKAQTEALGEVERLKRCSEYLLEMIDYVADYLENIETKITEKN